MHVLGTSQVFLENWLTVSTGFKCYFNSSNSHMKDEAVQVSFTTWKSLHCHSTVFQLVHVLSGDYFYFQYKNNRTLIICGTTELSFWRNAMIENIERFKQEGKLNITTWEIPLYLIAPLFGTVYRKDHRMAFVNMTSTEEAIDALIVSY